MQDVSCREQLRPCSNQTENITLNRLIHGYTRMVAGHQTIRSLHLPLSLLSFEALDAAHCITGFASPLPKRLLCERGTYFNRDVLLGRNLALSMRFHCMHKAHLLLPRLNEQLPSPKFRY